MNISKTTLDELIQFHEKQIADNQRRIDELRGYFEPKPTMFGQAFDLKDAEAMLYGNGETTSADGTSREFLAQGEYFISQEAAELESEKRRLRQLARVRMAESWGDERPDWSDLSQNKWGIKHNGNILVYCKAYIPLHFHTQEHAESFLDEVGERGIQLIWEL